MDVLKLILVALIVLGLGLFTFTTEVGHDVYCSGRIDAITLGC